jgi:hypothetical protein
LLWGNPKSEYRNPKQFASFPLSWAKNESHGFEVLIKAERLNGADLFSYDKTCAINK